MVGQDNMKSFLTTLILLAYLVGFSQSGKVVDKEGEPLPFVNVYSYTLNKGTTTDFDGIFKIDVPEGTPLVFSFVSYQTDTINASQNMEITLQDESLNLKEVVVMAERRNDGEQLLLMEKKNAEGVESSIGNKELTKKGITNAEDGLKKISGITFSKSKINVRGLGDRYNQLTLNGLPLPSNNPDKKNIDMSLIPRIIAGNIKVKKSYTSDQWSNIGASQIDINTNGVRDIRQVNFRVGMTYMDIINPLPSLTATFGKEGNKFGYLFSIRESYGFQNYYGNMSLINKQGKELLDYSYDVKEYSRDRNGVLILKYKIPKFSSTLISLYINSKNINDRHTFGDHFDYGKQIYTTRVTPTDNTLFTQQIINNYKNNNFYANANTSYSIVRSGEKDRTQFVYLYDGGYQFNNIDKMDNHHFWNQNNEDRLSFVLNGGYKFEKIKPEVGYGFMYMKNTFDYQQKFYDLYNVNYVNPSSPFEYINDDNSKQYEINDPASYVENYTIIHSGYYKNEINIKKVVVNMGSRLENAYQYLSYRDQLQPSILREVVNDNLEFLPFFNAKYGKSDKLQYRLNLSKTLVRPRFRELTPFLYTEVFAGSKIQGNPNLNNTDIYNADLGFEYYPKEGEMVGLTLYGKQLYNPIERVNVATASGRLETYQNSESASVIGGELDVKKKFGKFGVDYNLSVLWSEINISNNSNASVIVTNTKRQLQGASPVLSNIDIFYSLTDSINVGITYNYVGKKLESVGVAGLGDIYQQPLHLLNIVGNAQFKQFKLNASINNFLQTPYVRTQMADDGEHIVGSYRLGTFYSLGITLNF